MTEQKKNRLLLLLRTLITAVSAAVIVLLAVVNHYAHRTAGANHHVYYFKVKYAKTILGAQNLNLIAVFGLALLLVAIFLLLRQLRKKRLSRACASLATLMMSVSAVLLALFAFTDLFADQLMWAYFIFGLIALEVMGFLLLLASFKAKTD